MTDRLHVATNDGLKLVNSSGAGQWMANAAVVSGTIQFRGTNPGVFSTRHTTMPLP